MRRGTTSLRKHDGATMQFSFCMTACNRMDHVRQTLLHNAGVLSNLSETELVLLNYSDRSGLDQYVQSIWPELKRLLGDRFRYYRTTSPKSFHMANAKNVAHKQGRGEWLVNLDADNLLTSAYMEELKTAARVGADVIKFPACRELGGGPLGRIAIRRELFQKITGYDEDQAGWGHEDTDLIKRAEIAGALVFNLSVGCAKWLSHGDNLRPIQEKNMGDATRRWTDYFTSKRARCGFAANQGKVWGTVAGLEEVKFDNSTTSTHLTPPTDAGVVFCASPTYAEMVGLAIQSLLRVAPHLPHYCHIAAEGYASRESKLSVDLWTPFEKTLFLDCDVLVRRDPTELFNLPLDQTQPPIYMAIEKQGYSTLGETLEHKWFADKFGVSYIEELAKLPSSMTHFNSGVMLFRKSLAHDFFALWRHKWRRRGGATMDQLPLFEVCNELPPPMVLEPKYNDYLDSADAVISHFLGGSRDSKIQRMKAAVNLHISQPETKTAYELIS